MPRQEAVFRSILRCSLVAVAHRATDWLSVVAVVGSPLGPAAGSCYDVTTVPTGSTRACFDGSPWPWKPASALEPRTPSTIGPAAKTQEINSIP